MPKPNSTRPGPAAAPPPLTDSWICPWHGRTQKYAKFEKLQSSCTRKEIESWMEVGSTVDMIM